MQDLYRGFKKTAEDDAKATLEHENGHALTIAKSGLSKKQKAALAKLPLHQAKGTQIPQEQQPMPTMPDAGDQAKAVGVNIADAVANKILEGATEASTPAQQPQITPQQIEAMPFPNATEVATGQPAYKRAPEFAEGEGLTPEQILEIRRSGGDVRDVERLATERTMQENPEYFAQQPPTDEQGQVSLQQPTATNRGLAETPAAPAAPEIAQAPAAPTMAAQPAAPTDPMQILLDPKAPPSAKTQAFMVASYKRLQEQQEFDRKFYDEMKSQEIKAPDIMHNKSTLGKIGTVVAMALSGIGAGVTGKENTVMHILNDQIAKEIDAQKRNEERKFSLHKMYSEHFGSAAAADLQMANNLLNVAKMQIEEQEKGWGNNPLMRKRAQLANLEVDTKMAEHQQKLTQLKLDSDLRKGLVRTGTTADPALLVPSGIPEKQATKIEEEIRHRKEVNKSGKEILDWFDTINSVAYTPGATDSFQGLLTTLVPLIEGTSTVSAMEATKDKFTPKKFNPTAPGANENKRKALVQWLTSKSDDTAFRRATKGLNLDSFADTAHSWARDKQKTVTMVTPDGAKWVVPESQVEAAKQKFKAKVLTK